ncbi:MAG: fibrobacter succinogenes major paralogous domain-containing protein [Bacteroidales bacterium]
MKRNKSLFIAMAILNIAISSVAQTTGTFKDERDGKIYKTVKIGTQIWMAENLAYDANKGCWAYNNDITNVAKYGFLYNWETALTVAPDGWHLPTDTEWTILIKYLGGDSIAGGKLKSTTGWDSPNIGATNASGFSALPAGYINMLKSGLIGKYAFFWSANESNDKSAWLRYLKTDDCQSNRNYYFSKDYGFSVRCVKN